MTQTHDITEGLPAAPRAINARARKRSWAEASVRFWMILTFIVGLSLVPLSIESVRLGLQERRLIYRGVPTNAKVIEVNGDADPRHAVKWDGVPGDRDVKVQFPGSPADGRARQLELKKNNGRRPGDTIEIRVDPNDPTLWTDQTEATPWVSQLVIIWMLLPVILVVSTMMLLKRRQMLALWRDGEPLAATVIGISQSAIAPKSRVVRFTLQHPTERRVFLSFFPLAAGAINKGDEVLVLAMPGKNSRAIIAELYEE